MTVQEFDKGIEENGDSALKDPLTQVHHSTVLFSNKMSAGHKFDSAQMDFDMF